MLGADSSEEHVNVPGQSAGAGNRLAQNFCYLVVGKFVVGWREQHERSILISIDRHSTGRAVPRSRRLPHYHVVPLLQVSDKVIGHEFRHDIVAVSEPAAPVMLKRKAQREAKLVGIGRGQFGSVILHAGRLDQSGERIKNI
jgi:hypothetical protein